jgi:hypothetical protein
MQESQEIVQWPALVAAAAAAFAAAAAWRTAVINGRNLRRSIEPTLVAQPLAVGSQVHCDVHNVGGGIAVGCVYMLVAGDSLAQGYLHHGTLQPGSHLRVRSTLPAGPTPTGMVACRDSAGNVLAWRLGGLGRKKLGRVSTLADELTVAEIFARMVDDVVLDDLYPVPSEVLTNEELNATRDDPIFRPTPEQVFAAQSSTPGKRPGSRPPEPGP